MSRPPLAMLSGLAIAGVLLSAGAAFAQYLPGYQPPPGAMPYGYGAPPAQQYPDAADESDDDFYIPRERARPRAMQQGLQQGLQPGLQQGRPLTSYPSDADPDYSTAGGSDDDIDTSQTTRTTVLDPTGQAAGTLTINTGQRKLYLSMGDGRAVEYGIGVGRQGFAWKGEARVGRKAFWPGWTPPKEMLLRRPDLPAHMEGGLENPLGARALYLFQGNKDTLFRIHGTNEPDTIGKAVSSGCIRMLNADVMDLYTRVPKGARVVVL